jgi:hypothetical protein
MKAGHHPKPVPPCAQQTSPNREVKLGDSAVTNRSNPSSTKGVNSDLHSAVGEPDSSAGVVGPEGTDDRNVVFAKERIMLSGDQKGDYREVQEEGNKSRIGASRMLGKCDKQHVSQPPHQKGGQDIFSLQQYQSPVGTARSGGSKQ